MSISDTNYDIQAKSSMLALKKVKKISLDRLLKVVINGQVEQLQKLLEDESYSFDNLSTDEWDLLLKSAADNCRLEHLNVLLSKRGPSFPLSLSPRAIYARALRAACLQSKLELMELAIKHGAAVDSVGDDGLCCLHIAAKKQNIAAMQLLLKYKANINRVDSSQSLEHQSKGTPLHLSCILGNRESIGFLLDRGAAICVGGSNALADAARRLSILDMMINLHGVNIDTVDDFGRTALWQACHSSEPEYPVKALLQHGADPNNRPSRHGIPIGRPLLSSVCKKVPRKSIVKMLLSHGAAVDAISSSGKTALMYACAGGYHNVVKLLLEYGADVDIVDKLGRTALMHIIKAPTYTCLPLLLERDADVSIPFRHGQHKGKTILEVLGQGVSREAAMIREAAERQACSQPVLK